MDTERQGRRGLGARIRSRRADLVAAGIPLVWLLATSWPALAPWSTAWLERGDAASHWIGWLFFAREPWHWPPGRIESWLVPAGTTIGFADSIPLLAIPLKLLAGWTGTPFQYFGCWFAACLALQAILASRLLAELGAGERLRALGGALAGFSPVVWQRFDAGHFALAAQWLILAAMLAWTRFFASGGGRRYLLWLAALPVLAATIHPYFTLITGALLAAIILAASRFGWRRMLLAASLAIGAAAASLAVAYPAGFLGGAERLRAGAWGGYAADLGTFLDPGRRSRYLSALWFSSGNGEGFAYLGSGVLLAGGAALLFRLRQRRRPVSERPETRNSHGWKGLWIACALLAVIAALPVVRLFGRELFTAHRFTALVEVALGPFRANGRFVWPLHLLLLLSALRWLRPLEASRPRALVALLVLALAVQAPEPPTRGRGQAEGIGPQGQAVESLRQRYPGFESMRMLPVFLRDGGRIFCGGEPDRDAWVLPAYLAARAGFSFDSGYVARLDAGRARSVCREGAERIGDLRLEHGTVYVVGRRLARRLQRAGSECSRLEGNLWTCVSGPSAPREGRDPQGTAADQ